MIRNFINPLSAALANSLSAHVQISHTPSSSTQTTLPKPTTSSRRGRFATYLLPDMPTSPSDPTHTRASSFLVLPTPMGEVTLITVDPDTALSSCLLMVLSPGAPESRRLLPAPAQNSIILAYPTHQSTESGYGNSSRRCIHALS